MYVYIWTIMCKWFRTRYVQPMDISPSNQNKKQPFVSDKSSGRCDTRYACFRLQYRHDARMAYQHRMLDAYTGKTDYPRVRTFTKVDHSTNSVFRDLEAAEQMCVPYTWFAFLWETTTFSLLTGLQCFLMIEKR